MVLPYFALWLVHRTCTILPNKHIQNKNHPDFVTHVWPVCLPSPQFSLAHFNIIFLACDWPHVLVSVFQNSIEMCSITKGGIMKCLFSHTWLVYKILHWFSPPHAIQVEMSLESLRQTSQELSSTRNTGGQFYQAKKPGCKNKNMKIGQRIISVQWVLK